MNPEDRVREVLVKAAKTLEKDWHSAYAANDGEDWSITARSKLDQAVAEARHLIAEHADELCVIKSMNTDQFNHAPAELLVYTGSPRSGRPS